MLYVTRGGRPALPTLTVPFCLLCRLLRDDIAALHLEQYSGLRVQWMALAETTTSGEGRRRGRQERQINRGVTVRQLKAEADRTS